MPWWEMIIRLVLAIILGGLLGLNRELAHKPAGLKTHIMVCLGSSLIMLVSLELFHLYAGVSNTIDPGRIAAQVITGIGFLGAGTIMHAEGGLIRGLTTAASIWAVAGIGLACGGGMYVLAVATTLLAVGTLAIINRFLPASERRSRRLQKKD
ncbi:MgtC/SapB family protein [bacterium]|nr:MgtC/SapB family protein [bacterium]